jgi:hypothetical protein
MRMEQLNFFGVHGKYFEDEENRFMASTETFANHVDLRFKLH